MTKNQSLMTQSPKLLRERFIDKSKENLLKIYLQQMIYPNYSDTHLMRQIGKHQLMVMLAHQITGANMMWELILRMITKQK